MQPSRRLLSLDTLRGLDMLLIMGLGPLVTSLCALWPSAATDAVARSMYHAAWNGRTLEDTIFPLFLFIAGISFPFSLAKQRAAGLAEGRIRLRILRRTAVLVLLGAVYNGLFDLDFATLRWASVLGRIGLAWGVAALLYLRFGVRTRIGIAAATLLVYGLLSALVAAPDVPGAVPLTFEGNLAGYVDRLLLPGKLYLGTFDPEGLFSTVPAVVTAMLGMFTGEFIRRGDLSGGRKTAAMVLGAAVLLALGLAFDGVLPINKQLWSSTFVCAVGGYSLGLFALVYYVVDVRGRQRWTFFFRVVGLNSITIYLAQRIVDFQAVADFFFGGLAAKLPPQFGAVLLAAGYLAVSWLFLWALYRKRVFLKV